RLLIDRGDRHELRHVVVRLGRKVVGNGTAVGLLQRGEDEHATFEAELVGRRFVHLVRSLCGWQTGLVSGTLGVSELLLLRRSLPWSNTVRRRSGARSVLETKTAPR